MLLISGGLAQPLKTFGSNLSFGVLIDIANWTTETFVLRYFYLVFDFYNNALLQVAFSLFLVFLFL